MQSVICSSSSRPKAIHPPGLRGAAMDALARAKQLRADAVEAQSARLAADAARTEHNAERAKEYGLVEKTAGESGTFTQGELLKSSSGGGCRLAPPARRY